MKCLAFATDFDGTIAEEGVVDKDTIAALERLKASGCKLILVTGRELPELIQIFPDILLFDLVVAENGAIMYDPHSREEIVLAPTPSGILVERLRAEGVPNISVGRSIIALWKPHEVTALAAIRDLGLELHIVFNKQAVMILPSNVSKASGLAEACARLSIDPANVVGIGDAENDHAFLEACGFGAAVANAIPSLKERVVHITDGARGKGATEMIEFILDDKLDALIARAASRTQSERR